MKNLLLNENWDICLDGNGRIATTEGEYAIAQSAANAARLFVNDAYFNATKGIPHFSAELGQDYEASQSVFSNRLKQAVMNVEGGADCDPQLEYSENGRIIEGRILITLENGATVAIEM